MIQRHGATITPPAGLHRRWLYECSCGPDHTRRFWSRLRATAWAAVHGEAFIPTCSPIPDRPPPTAEPTEEIPAGAVEIGRITTVHYLDHNGTPRVTVHRPDFEALPALVQLGMVELTRKDVMDGPDDQEEWT